MTHDSPCGLSLMAGLHDLHSLFSKTQKLWHSESFPQVHSSIFSSFGCPRSQTVWFSHGVCFCVLGGAVALLMSLIKSGRGYQAKLLEIPYLLNWMNVNHRIYLYPIQNNIGTFIAVILGNGKIQWCVHSTKFCITLC